jgi:hypothetical protein
MLNSCTGGFVDPGVLDVMDGGGGGWDGGSGGSGGGGGGGGDGGDNPFLGTWETGTGQGRMTLTFSSDRFNISASIITYTGTYTYSGKNAELIYSSEPGMPVEATIKDNGKLLLQDLLWTKSS